MSDFRIMDANFAFDTAITLSASSEDSNFPVSNLRNPLRTKVWRSNELGNFVIDATNDNIDFDEGGGELNGTIASGTFTASGLESAIKTAMEAVGGNTYTISFSTITGRWTITTSGGTLSLLWSSGANSGTSVGSDIGFDTSSDDTGSTSYVSDFIAIHTEEFIKFDLNTAQDVDSFAMVFDPLDGIKFSSSAVLKLQANATDDFSAPTVDVTLVIDTVYSTITNFFSTTQNFRFWRISIVDPTNTNLNVEVSKVILSEATQLGQVPQNGFSDTLVDQSTSVTNKFGHQYFDEYPSRRAFSFSHAFMSKEDIETLFTIYKTVGRVTPIGIALDSQATVYDKDRFFMYGRFTNSFQANQVFFTFFDQDIEVLEAL